MVVIGVVQGQGAAVPVAGMVVVVVPLAWTTPVIGVVIGALETLPMGMGVGAGVAGVAGVAVVVIGAA